MSQYQRLSLRRFLNLGPYEDDEQFRELLAGIARKGLLVAGMLGTVALLIFLIGQIFIIPKDLVLSYSDLNPRTEIAIWLPGFILLSCLSMIWFSKSAISLGGSRRLIFLIVWLISFFMLLEDLNAGDINYATAYISLVLILAITAIPYKGWQTVLLTLTVIITTIMTVNFVPAILNLPPLEPKISQLVYIILISILLTGISSLLYLNRYDQFEARQRAEQLKDQLEKRAHMLEMMKEKSDRQAQKILENEKLKDRFFANISHEFRTPLTLILGPLEDLLSEGDKEEKKPVGTGLLQLMHKNGTRLLKMINQLLDLSKIDAGEIRMEMEPMNLSELVRETALAFVPMAESRKVNLEIDVDEGLCLMGDPQQLERVVRNLVSNALKFTPEKGRVGVYLSETDENLELAVEDTGRGIPEEELPHIFDRFYQTKNSSEIMDRGTGIGLALVKEIIDLHDGTVDVTSKYGEGTTFTVQFKKEAEMASVSNPIDIPAMNQTVSKTDMTDEQLFLEDEGDQQERSENAPTVVLIDDNPDILAYLQPILSRRYEVTAFHDSTEAIRSIESSDDVDLVISDVMMPEPDGFELCKRLKRNKETNHIPVILLTARAGEESRLEGLELGADDYISKPFSAAELMTRAENLIELRQTLREKYSGEVRLKGKKVEVTSEDARFLEKVQSVIEEHLEDSNFGVDWLADEIHLSPRQLQRKIRSITDLSAAGYIRMIRLERARQLLTQNWGNVSEIAYKVGYQDSKYFSRLFRQTFGQSPTDYAAKTGEI
ncbi:MAG: ATP-binding protein [Balneolaceae bacterium]|nr:ATP-binding protein [Balneolaceae bacterium]